MSTMSTIKAEAASAMISHAALFRRTRFRVQGSDASSVRVASRSAPVGATLALDTLMTCPVLIPALVSERPPRFAISDCASTDVNGKSSVIFGGHSAGSGSSLTSDMSAAASHTPWARARGYCDRA